MLFSISIKHTDHQLLYGIHFPDLRRDRLPGLLEAINKVKLARASLLMIGDAFAVMKQLIMLQKKKKAGRCNPFVAINETMVSHNQVKEGGSFFFKGRVEILFPKAFADL